MVRRANERGLYSLLFVLFAAALAYQVSFAISSLQLLALLPQMGRTPFVIPAGTNQLIDVAPPLAEAGVQDGDQLIAIEGEPYRSRGQVTRIMERHHPGDLIELIIRRAGGVDRRVSVRLGKPIAAPLNFLGWSIATVLVAITPISCILLGFGVLAIRPRDPLAWLLMVLMLGFAQISTGEERSVFALLTWPDIIRPAALFYHRFFSDAWPISMLLFGMWFPQRSMGIRFWNIILFVLAVPIALAALASATLIAGNSIDYRLVAWLPDPVRNLDRIGLWASVIAVWGFFFAVYVKLRVASADVRRRLRLMLAGAFLALFPFFVYVMGRVFQAGWADLQIVRLFSTAMLVFFPLTLAYVIIVQRALDVRVVIRQGLRYALATRGIRIMRAALLAATAVLVVLLVNNPARNPAQKSAAILIGILAWGFVRRGADRLREWTDRRFFREAYKTEQILSDLSDKVRTMVETGPLLETVAGKISESLHVDKIAMLVRKNGNYQPAYALGYEHLPRLMFDDSAGTVRQMKTSREPLRIYFDDPHSWIYQDHSISEKERAALQALSAELVLPLAVKERLTGFITLGPKRSEEPYTTSDVQLLESVAAQTGLALENSQLTAAIAREVAERERMNRELEIAREVQERLFPQIYPAVPGLDLAGHCRPALGVGGDYYDFLALPNQRLGLAIGDVSGKGVPAALLMASLQACLRGQTLSGPPDLGTLMSNVNRLVYEATPPSRYASFFYGQYDPATHELKYVNAGHNAPILLRGSDIARLEEGGVVIGLFPERTYAQGFIELQAGDVMVLFTDGVTEAMNNSEEEWGEGRFVASVKSHRGLGATDLMNAVFADVDAFTGGAPQHDDMTLMVIKVIGG